MRDTIDTFNQEQVMYKPMAEMLKTNLPPLNEVGFTHVSVSFEDIESIELRNRLGKLPTTFNLEKEDVDSLAAAAKFIILQSQDLNVLKQ